MYAKEQFDRVANLVENLADSASTEGCGEDLTVVDTVALDMVLNEVRRLKALNQRLLQGRHEHGFGETTYLFLVPEGVEFGVEELKQRLEEEYEPHKGEFLHVDSHEEPTVICGTTAA